MQPRKNIFAFTQCRTAVANAVNNRYQWIPTQIAAKFEKKARGVIKLVADASAVPDAVDGDEQTFATSTQVFDATEQLVCTVQVTFTLRPHKKKQ